MGSSKHRLALQHLNRPDGIVEELDGGIEGIGYTDSGNRMMERCMTSVGGCLDCRLTSDANPLINGSSPATLRTWSHPSARWTPRTNMGGALLGISEPIQLSLHGTGQVPNEVLYATHTARDNVKRGGPQRLL